MGAAGPAAPSRMCFATQPSVLEWRLLSPSPRGVVAGGGQIVVMGPARHGCSRCTVGVPAFDDKQAHSMSECDGKVPLRH